MGDNLSGIQLLRHLWTRLVTPISKLNQSGIEIATVVTKTRSEANERSLEAWEFERPKLKTKLKNSGLYLTGDKQHGYKQGKSTITAAMTIQSMIECMT